MELVNAMQLNYIEPCCCDRQLQEAWRAAVDHPQPIFHSGDVLAERILHWLTSYPRSERGGTLWLAVHEVSDAVREEIESLLGSGCDVWLCVQHGVIPAFSLPQKMHIGIHPHLQSSLAVFRGTDDNYTAIIGGLQTTPAPSASIATMLRDPFSSERLAFYVRSVCMVRMRKENHP